CVTGAAPGAGRARAVVRCGVVPGAGGRGGARPGSAVHTARGAPPPATWARNAAPARYGAHTEPASTPVVPGAVSPAAAPPAAAVAAVAVRNACSARAWRGGTARRSTSERVPA